MEGEIRKVTRKSQITIKPKRYLDIMIIFQILYVFLRQKYKNMKMTLDVNLHSL